MELIAIKELHATRFLYTGKNIIQILQSPLKLNSSF